ncbi:hypothetical protein [Streptomyces melanogenes]|uniref:hypothetical protein n=1 Tax=Streptomyces melanogenes TaxID=67326 RepID=UPI00167E255F|nr:hypothetical protein [Streptomyces melanogenes]GGP55466.1 hypothetical protein GCM10010278_35420 [Streptomyces melanogenes]
MSKNVLRRAALGLVSLAMACTASLIGTGTASAQHNYPGMLYQGESLDRGEYIETRYGNWNDQRIYRLIMQWDGNLVLYKTYQGNQTVCWASHTWGSDAVHAVYQTDGNFVLYTAGGTVPWASNTVGKGGQTVNINNFGGLYVGYTRISSNCG